ncbi:MAG: tetratricopeptide repeat protein [Promethearchaeota archaeon]
MTELEFPAQIYLDESIEWFEKANTLLKEGKFFEANEALEQALRVMPKFEKDMIAEAWKLKGIALKNLGKNNEALQALDKAIAFDPNSVEAWINKGKVLIKLKKPKGALSALNRAVQLEPKNSEALTNKGVALTHLKRYREALDAHDQALELVDKRDPIIWNAKGTTLFLMMKYNEALKCFNQAIELKPNYELALANKNRTLKKLGAI